MTFRVGLTGGIAAGKSTVAGLFSELGIAVIDADQIAREVVCPGSSGLAEVVARFGDKVLLPDGRLDRKVLRDIIFSDPQQRELLNSILHPRIREKMLQRSNLDPGPYHVLDIPLLVESQWREMLDRIVVVDCDPRRQIERLIKRDGESEASAQQILIHQSSREQRLSIADDVISNDGPIEALAQQVYELHQSYLQLAFAKKSARGDSFNPRN